MFVFWRSPIIFTCEFLIYYHSHSDKKFIVYTYFLLQEFFRTYNIKTFKSIRATECPVAIEGETENPVMKTTGNAQGNQVFTQSD